MEKITLPDGRVVDNPFAEISEKAMEEKATPTTTDVSSLGKATYSWAKPGALQVAPNTYNAKTLPYSGTQGVGLANYGWNESNIIDKINFSRKKSQEGDKSGGYKEIFENMGNWANKYSPELKSFLDSGQVSEGLNMDTVLQAADYGLRSSAQKQQNKKGFFDSAFGKILSTAATIGASAINPYLGAAVGAGLGGAQGGLKGAVLGGLSGYGSGQFIEGFRNFQPVMPNQMSGLANFTGRVGAGFGNLPGASTLSQLGASTGLGNNLTTGLLVGQGLQGLVAPQMQMQMQPQMQNIPNFGLQNFSNIAAVPYQYNPINPVFKGLQSAFQTSFDVNRDPRFGVA